MKTPMRMMARYSRNVGSVLFVIVLSTSLCFPRSDAFPHDSPIPVSDTTAVRSLNETALRSTRSANHLGARRTAFQALQLAESLNDTRGAAFSQRILAYSYRFQSQRDQQLKHYLESLKLFERTGDAAETAEAQRLVGQALFYLKRNAQAKEYFDRALATFTSLQDARGIAEATSNLGQISFENGNYRRSLALFTQAYATADSMNNASSKSVTLGRMSYAYWKLGEPQAMLTCLQQSLAIEQRGGDSDRIADVYGDIGLAYTELKHYDKAIDYLGRALRTAEAIDAHERQQVILEYLAVAYEKQGDFKTALRYQQRAMNVHATSFKQELHQEISALQRKYDVEKEELQNQLLRRDVADQKNNVLYLSLALVLILFVSIIGYIAKRKANLALRTKNEFIEHQRGELQQRVQELKHTEAALQRANEGLEQHVKQRTNQLSAMNDDLRREVNERKQLEQRLVQAQKLESLGTLAGGVAHDFNNILNIILGHNDLLGRSLEHATQYQPRIEAIARATQRGADLVKQLLTFARKTEPHTEAVQLNDMIQELSQLLGGAFPKNIAIRLYLDEHLPFVVADRAQIHQVLLNLSVNARDAMPRGGTLTMTTMTRDASALRARYPDAIEERYVAVSVEDTGIGMGDETRRHLFEPFFTTKGVGKGTGLGLPVVYGVVNAHHGFVDVESAPDEGTTFTLYFPASLHAALPHSSISPPMKDSLGGKETILVVEDERDLREMLTTVLTVKGYSVLTAHDGEEAVQLFDEHRTTIDIVVSDLGLPKRNGWEALQLIRARVPGIKVIVASGFFDPHVKTEMNAAGLRHFMQKPYSPAELLRKVREALDETHPGNKQY